MRRLLLVCLLTLPLFAQGTDLAVSIRTTSDPGRPTQTYVIDTTWNGAPVQNPVLEIDLPADRIGSIGGSLGFWDCERHSQPIRCTAKSTVPAFDGSVVIFAFFDRGGAYTTTARLTSDTPDPNPANNVATHVNTLTGKPSLFAATTFDFDGKTSFDPGETVPLRMTIQNSGFDATGVTLTARLPDGGMFTGAEFEWGEGERPACTLTALEVTCQFQRLDTSQFGVIDLAVTAPPRNDGGTFPIATTAEAAEDDADDSVHRLDVTLRRQMIVTTAADDGAGSLRQRILEANALCEKDPCTIGFDGVALIQPRTPLPELHGVLKIDGGSARMVLDGALLTEGDALRYRNGCDFTVTRMRIRNFPGHGIDVRSDDDATVPCLQYLSAAIAFTENELANNFRGIVSHRLNSEIVGNVIRDHRRAGVFIDRVFWTLIRGNTITGNGAAGVFINPSESAFGVPAGADVMENVIRNNGEFGVAYTAHGLVAVQRNEIAQNRHYAIDVNLDLDTPNREVDVPGVPNKPMLLAATYDPVTNSTRVRGAVQTRGGGVLDFYASHSLSTGGHPDAERWIRGNVPVNATTTDFEAELPGDLRGQWITATCTRGETVFFARPPEGTSAASSVRTDVMRPTGGGTTSEISNAVQVN